MLPLLRWLGHLNRGLGLVKRQVWRFGMLGPYYIAFSWAAFHRELSLNRDSLFLELGYLELWPFICIAPRVADQLPYVVCGMQPCIHPADIFLAYRHFFEQLPQWAIYCHLSDVTASHCDCISL